MTAKEVAETLNEKGWTAGGEAPNVEKWVWTGKGMNGVDKDFIQTKKVPLQIWIEMVKIDISEMEVDSLPW